MPLCGSGRQLCLPGRRDVLFSVGRIDHRKVVFAVQSVCISGISFPCYHCRLYSALGAPGDRGVFNHGFGECAFPVPAYRKRAEIGGDPQGMGHLGVIQLHEKSIADSSTQYIFVAVFKNIRSFAIFCNRAHHDRAKNPVRPGCHIVGNGQGRQKFPAGCLFCLCNRKDGRDHNGGYER